ncbi:MAG: hypothetical protein ACR652_15055 [Methylocystis sp.]|uniref:hypothetical protein n=1 Tax=Methylocystis sp. TaxID=1911079 RepID=UPI003DA27D0D
MIVGKREFSEKLGISPGRVSQYISAGMPQRADGQLDFESAAKWIASNIDGKAGEAAHAILRELRGKASSRGAKDDPDNPVVAGSRIALASMFVFVPNVAARAAKNAGVDEETVEKIRRFAFEEGLAAANVVNDTLLGLPPRDLWPDYETCVKFGVTE